MRLSRLLTAALLTASVFLIAIVAGPPVAPPRTDEGPILPRKELLTVLGASHRVLISDYYWLRSVQQTGIARTEAEYRDISFFANLSTDLDPHFRYVYEWGGVSTPFNRGREHWVNADLAERLLRKGLHQFPGDASLLFHLGFNLMSYQKRYHDAAEVFLSFAGRSDVPAHFVGLGTRLLAAAGDFEGSRQATLLMRDYAKDEAEREYYALRLLEITREEELRKIDAAVATYRERFGRLPENLDVLKEAGLTADVRADPLDGEYFLDLNGVARSTSGAYRLEPYTVRKKREVFEAIPTEYQ